jgi:protein required for attachment to host cells
MQAEQWACHIVTNINVMKIIVERQNGIIIPVKDSNALQSYENDGDNVELRSSASAKC